MVGETRRELDMRHLAIFCSPILLVQAVELPWRLYLPAFFSQQLALPLGVTGALLMWVRLFDMAADPLIGWASDLWQTRAGLRKPWMAAGLPLLMLGSWHVFFVEPGISIAALALACFMLHLGFSAIAVPHGAWSMEIADSYHGRTRVIGAKTWLALMGTPLILAIPALAERVFGAELGEQVRLMGVTLLIFAPLSIILVLSVIRERRVEHAAPGYSLTAAFRAAAQDPALRCILILYSLVGISDAASSGTFLFLVDHALGLEGWGSTLILAQMLMGLVSIPLWARVSRHWGKRRALMGVFCWKAVIPPFALLLPEGQLLPLIAFLILANGAVAGDYLLLRTMMADLSGRDLERDGRRTAGTYYALSSVALKFAAALGVGAAFWLLAQGGFDPNTPVDRQAGIVVRLIYSIPSSLAALLACWVLWRNGRSYDYAGDIAPLAPG